MLSMQSYWGWTILQRIGSNFDLWIGKGGKEVPQNTCNGNLVPQSIDLKMTKNNNVLFLTSSKLYTELHESHWILWLQHYKMWRSSSGVNTFAKHYAIYFHWVFDKIPGNTGRARSCSANGPGVFYSQGWKTDQLLPVRRWRTALGISKDSSFTKTMSYESK